MTIPTFPGDRILGVAQRSVDATSAAVRTWTEVAERYAGSITVENPMPRAADVRTAVGASYDLAVALLSEQRNLVDTLIDAGVQAASTWTEQARTAAASIPFHPFDVAGHRGAAA